MGSEFSVPTALGHLQAMGLTISQNQLTENSAISLLARIGASALLQSQRLPRHSSFRGSLVCMLSQCLTYEDLPFLQNAFGCSERSIRRYCADSASLMQLLLEPAASPTREHTSADRAGVIAFLEHHQPPPSGARIMSGQLFSKTLGSGPLYCLFLSSYHSVAMPAIAAAVEGSSREFESKTKKRERKTQEQIAAAVAQGDSRYTKCKNCQQALTVETLKRKGGHSCLGRSHAVEPPSKRAKTDAADLPVLSSSAPSPQQTRTSRSFPARVLRNVRLFQSFHLEEARVTAMTRIVLKYALGHDRASPRERSSFISRIVSFILPEPNYQCLGPKSFRNCLKTLFLRDESRRHWPPCPHCAGQKTTMQKLEKFLDTPESMRSSKQKGQITRLRKEIATRPDHLLCWERHHRLFQNSTKTVQVGELVLVLDFWSATMGTSFQCYDCVFVVFTRPAKEQPIRRQYVDVLCSDPKTKTNDFFFFREATLQVFKLPEFSAAKKVTFWSDGGSKHFKNVFSLAFFSTLKSRFKLKSLSWLFFAAYHGRSLADGHAGKVSQAVVFEANSTGQGWRDAAGLGRIIQNRLNNARAIVLDSIPRKPALKPSVVPLKTVSRRGTKGHTISDLFALEVVRIGVLRGATIWGRQWSEIQIKSAGGKRWTPTKAQRV